jgi:transposase-like protein
MSRVNVVNQESVRKDYSRILEPLEERVRGIVLNVLGGIETDLSRELHGIGLEVMRAVMECEREEIVGIKGRHNPDRRYVRGGSNPGSVVIGGAKVACRIPRARDVEAGVEYDLQSRSLFQQAGEVCRRAYRDLIRGISTRRYAEGVDAFLDGYGVSASVVSRQMVKATSQKVEELFTRSIAQMEIAVLMIDGVEIGGHTVVVVLGIDTAGKKHILGLRQGATENTAVVKGLLEELAGRGLRTEGSILVVIDGAKALRKAVADVLGKDTPVQRCTVHKKRNVLEHLGKGERSWVNRRMGQAYASSDVQVARRDLVRLVEELRPINPSAARSLEEGLDETLTVQRLGIPEALRVSLRSTNIIESANNGVRDRTRNVKRWRDGMQVERWSAAALLETEKGFRRIKGYRHMAVLIAALENYQRLETEAA